MFRTNDQLGPYTLIRPLGRGGYGVVWLAERRGAIATTRVAVKLPLAEDPDWAAIAQESQLWARLGSHPNLLSIIEADIYDNQVVIVSEYAPDGSLDSWLRTQGGVTSLPSALRMLGGILAGLAHLHGRGVIHRDLKPANILLQGETPRLADFGLARRLKASAHSGKIAGTPAYMAPEVFDGKRSEQTDIWSVGVILYEMLSGRLPYPQVEFSVLLGAILRYPPDPLPATLPPPIQQFIWQALAKDPTQRFQTAHQMRHSLKNLILENLSLITRDELLINGILHQLMADADGGFSLSGAEHRSEHKNIPNQRFDTGPGPLAKERIAGQPSPPGNPSSEYLPGAVKMSDNPDSLASIDINLSGNLSGNIVDVDNQSQMNRESHGLNFAPFSKNTDIHPAAISPLGLSQTLPTIPLSGVLPHQLPNLSVQDHQLTDVVPVLINERKDVSDLASPGSLNLLNYQFETRKLDLAGNLLTRELASASYFIESLDDIAIEMVAVPAGQFSMGSRTEENPPADELLQHLVQMSAFFLGKYPVTQAQWRVVAQLPRINRDLNPAPSSFLGDQLPVEQISWLDAEEFCARLSQRTGRAYRLPSEAEWEYAGRAGSTTPFAFGETLTTTIANFNGNYPFAQAARGINRAQTIPVGSLGVANQFGLYDMHGNVWEWCQDIYLGSYQTAAQTGSQQSSIDQPHSNRALRVYRGGSWYDIAGFCRSAYRNRNLPIYRNLNLGFRIAVTIG